MLVIKISGKAYKVFVLLELLAQYYKGKTLADIIRERSRANG